MNTSKNQAAAGYIVILNAALYPRSVHNYRGDTVAEGYSKPKIFKARRNAQKQADWYISRGYQGVIVEEYNGRNG